MTVSYQYEVASSTSGGFTRLLFMWKGSLYKLIYRELVLFLLAFGILSALYRNLFTVDQKRLFEKVVVYCDTFINLIPLSFVLGFYVAYVAARWWNQYLAIPWPDKIMHSIALYVHGNDDQARMTRRTLVRYLNLTLILVLRSISSAVKRRFPKLDHLVEAGFMTPTELQMYQSVPSLEFNTYWIPCTWFINLLKETRRSNRIADPQGLKMIMEEFNEYRSQCGMLWSYDWVSIPLVYTQVVTIATYSFFLAALVGRQYVDEDRKSFQMEIDIYLPVFTILQFFFYMGLLKVAEQLINPFGDDDEDFELNWLIDRHTKVSYLGVDTLMTRCPPLVKDMYYNDVNLTLPYTEAAVAYKRKTYRGSVHNMVVPEEQHAMFLPEIEEEDEDESVSGTRTPKTSILSLHLAGQPQQSQPQQQPQQQQGAQQPPPPQHSPAEGIWRRNSDRSRKGGSSGSSGAGGPTGPARGARGSRATGAGPPGASSPGQGPGQGPGPGPAPGPTDRVEPPDTPVMGRRRSVLRNESFHSWKSFFSSLAGSRRDQHSSASSLASSLQYSEDDGAPSPPPSPPPSPTGSGSSVSTSVSSPPSATASPRTSPARDPSVSPSRVSPPLARVSPPCSPRASPTPGRPRLRSCPKLLVLVGRNDSSAGRKKGVRWKPVLDDSRRAARRRASDDDPLFLCRGCRERMVPLPALMSTPDLSAMRRARQRRHRPPLGSAPELSDAGFVRDDSYWRGGKFPGTGPGLGQRSGSRGILKKMMFWRGEATGVGGGVGRVEVGPPGPDSVVVIEPSPPGLISLTPLTRSLPDIASRSPGGSTPSLPSLPLRLLAAQRNLQISLAGKQAPLTPEAPRTAPYSQSTLQTSCPTLQSPPTCGCGQPTVGTSAWRQQRNASAPIVQPLVPPLRVEYPAFVSQLGLQRNASLSSSSQNSLPGEPVAKLSPSTQSQPSKPAPQVQSPVQAPRIVQPSVLMSASMQPSLPVQLLVQPQVQTPPQTLPTESPSPLQSPLPPVAGHGQHPLREEHRAELPPLLPTREAKESVTRFHRPSCPKRNL